MRIPLGLSTGTSYISVSGSRNFDAKWFREEKLIITSKVGGSVIQLQILEEVGTLQSQIVDANSTVGPDTVNLR
jgi:hypothetical protein